MDRWKKILKYLALCLGIALLIVFFAWAEHTMTHRLAQRTGPLMFESIPPWVSNELRMNLVALAGGSKFALRKGVAGTVGHDLAVSPWLEQVRVQTLAHSLLVTAQWRKPVALVKNDGRDFYVDANGVALQPLALPKLPIITIKGVKRVSDTAWGRPVQREDLNAALALIKALTDMDRIVAKQAQQKGGKARQSLLFELNSLDVANYNGRVNDNKPHLVLHAKDGTSIIWGAEIGAWGRNLEAPDDVKLGRLFTYYYYERGTLLGGPPVLRLNLPQGDRPDPLYRH